MTYINSRGEIVHQKPFTNQIFEYFYGFINVIILFFRTLIEPLLGKNTKRIDHYRPGQSSSGGGGGSGGGNNKKKRLGGMGDFASGGPNAPPCSTSS